MVEQYYIYKHTNKINGKIYIGQTHQNPERRWRPDGSGYKDSPKFWRAIQKYGWDNFEHEIIEIVKNEKLVNEREIYWIAYYDTFDNDEKGYNMTPGGGNYMQELWKDPEYRAKMLESFKKARLRDWSKKEFAEARLKSMLDGLHKAWNNPDWRSKRINNILGNKNPNSKAVINIETGKVFTTIKEASEWSGLKSVSGIGQCCKGKRKTSGTHPETGEPLHWRYAEEGGELN